MKPHVSLLLPIGTALGLFIAQGLGQEATPSRLKPGGFLQDYAGMREVPGERAGVWEHLSPEREVHASMVLALPPFRHRREPPAYDEGETARRAHERLTGLLSPGMFRGVRGSPVGADLLLEVFVTEFISTEAMSGGLLQVEGQLLDVRSGSRLGRVQVTAQLFAYYGRVPPGSRDALEDQVAEALFRFLERAKRGRQ